VMNDDLIVSREIHIELEDLNSEFEGVPEGCDRVLGAQRRSTPVRKHLRRQIGREKQTEAQKKCGTRLMQARG